MASGGPPSAKGPGPRNAKELARWNFFNSRDLFQEPYGFFRIWEWPWKYRRWVMYRDHLNNEERWHLYLFFVANGMQPEDAERIVLLEPFHGTTAAANPPYDRAAMNQLSWFSRHNPFTGNRYWEDIVTTNRNVWTWIIVEHVYANWFGDRRNTWPSNQAVGAPEAYQIAQLQEPMPGHPLPAPPPPPPMHGAAAATPADLARMAEQSDATASLMADTILLYHEDGDILDPPMWEWLLNHPHWNAEIAQVAQTYGIIP